MKSQLPNIAPGLYSDRIVVRCCKTLAYSARDKIKELTPTNMAEAIEFVRAVSSEWDHPSGVICNLFDSRGSHGFTFTYATRVCENYMQYPEHEELDAAAMVS